MGRESCMIYKPPTRQPIKNQRPSGPLCEGCLASELYCQACMYDDNAPCCPGCCHRDASGKVFTVDGIRPQAQREAPA